MDTLTDLENRIRAETEAARAAMKVALQHAANVGKAYGEVRDITTVAELNAWLAGKDCPTDRHSLMVFRRISLCEDLDTKARTLSDLAFDRMAEYIAQGAPGYSRSETIEINRNRIAGLA